MDDKYLVALTGIVCLTLIECTALLQGVDKELLAVCVGAICTLVGFCFGLVVGVKKLGGDGEGVEVPGDVSVMFTSPWVADNPYWSRHWFDAGTDPHRGDS